MAKLGLMALLNLDITRFENNMKKASNKTSLLQGAMKSLGPTIAAAFSIGAITAFAKAGFDAYQKQLEAETKLQSALGGREDIMRRLSDQANDLEGLTLFDDDAIVTTQSFFASLGLGEEAIRSLTPLVIDFAARFGMDLDAAAKAVGKAINGNGKAFKDLGFDIEGAAGSGERFDSILNQLNGSVKGQAAELAKLPVNQIKALGVAWDNFKEDIVANNAPFILAVLDKLTKKSGELLDKTNKLTGTKTAEDVEDVEFDKFAKADEAQKKVILKQWQDFYDQSKKNYEHYRDVAKEGYGGANRSFFSGQMLSMDILIKKAKKYADEQTKVTKVDEEAIVTAAKLADENKKNSSLIGQLTVQKKKLEDQKTYETDYNNLILINQQLEEVSAQLTFIQGYKGESFIDKDLLNQTIAQGKEEVSLPEVSIDVEADTSSFDTLINNIEAKKTALADKLKSMNDAVKGAMNDMAVAFAEGIGTAIVTGDFSALFKSIVESFAGFLQTFGKLLIGYAIATDAFKKTFTNPFAAIAAGVGLIALGAAIKALIAKQQGGMVAMADGGIVSGATQVLVGEYPGARSNPEVIAPLDKLSGLMSGNDQQINVRGKLSGADILISSERYSKQRTRVRGF